MLCDWPLKLAISHLWLFKFKCIKSKGKLKIFLAALATLQVPNHHVWVAAMLSDSTGVQHSHHCRAFHGTAQP